MTQFWIRAFKPANSDRNIDTAEFLQKNKKQQIAIRQKMSLPHGTGSCLNYA